MTQDNAIQRDLIARTRRELNVLHLFHEREMAAAIRTGRGPKTKYWHLQEHNQHNRVSRLIQDMQTEEARLLRVRGNRVRTLINSFRS